MAHEAREPKHRTKAPVHQRTSVIMPSESCTSDGSEDHPRAKAASRMAMASKTAPMGTFGPSNGRREGHPLKIRTALMGRISRMWA